jgi:hypothetical protein
MAQKTESRKIKHLAFAYLVEQPHPYEPDKTVFVERLARRGDTVELLPYDVAKGERFGSFYTEEEEQAVEEQEVALNDLDTEELSDWLNSDGEFEGDQKPTVNQVLNAAKGNPDLATRLVEAENLATDGDPRSSLIEGLAKIAGGND